MISSSLCPFLPLPLLPIVGQGTWQCDRQLPSLLGLLPRAHCAPGLLIPALISIQTSDPSGSCAETPNIPCFELFDFMEWKHDSFIRLEPPFARLLFTALVWLVLLFTPDGAFVTITHWQLDGHANMHGKAHLAAASATQGKEKELKVMTLESAREEAARPRLQGDGGLSTWRLLSSVVCS